MCTGQWEHTENNILAGSGDKCHTEVTFRLGWREGISRWMSAQGVSMSETPCSGPQLDLVGAQTYQMMLSLLPAVNSLSRGIRISQSFRMSLL